MIDDVAEKPAPGNGGPWYVQFVSQTLARYGLATVLAIGLIVFGGWLFAGKMSALELDMHDHVRDTRRLLSALCRMSARQAGESEVICDEAIK